MNRLTVITVITLATVAAAQPKAKGIESSGYVWNAQVGEKLVALRLKGDLKRGAAAYAVCTACHLADGAGRPDGNFPLLGGQHTTVLIKQLADIRSGQRDNPIMYPYATTLTDPQELADVAVYIQQMKPPEDNGKGPGIDGETGKKLYRRDCASCHGGAGEGDATKFFPVVAGQHYRYLLRQAQDIRDGRRRNSNPVMVRAIKTYTDKEIDAVADYLSRLQRPSRN
jgi:cytochrome c553